MARRSAAVPVEAAEAAEAEAAREVAMAAAGGASNG